jgi:hypothetical protein
MRFKHIFQFSQVDIPFERMIHCGVECLIDGAIDGGGFSEFDVPFGGVEMGIAGDDSPLV